MRDLFGMKRIPAAGVCAVLIALVASFTIAENIDPATVSAEIRGIGIDQSGAVRISGFSLRAGLAKVVLSDGILVPSTTVAGRAVEFVFLGEGRIELEPPDEIEAGQLELFTGSENLHESFNRAVFVVALDAAADAIARKAPSPDGARVEEAAELLDAWLSSPERRMLDVEARIFADAVGDRLAAGFFCGFFEGLELGRFLYLVDPMAQEQVTLGQFVQADLSKRDEKKVRRSIRKANRQGKLIGLEVEDLGTWDTWISSSLYGSGGAQMHGARGVEPEHYEIDLTLEGRDLDLEATIRIELSVVVDGIRAIAFEMAAELQPVRVEDGAGRRVDWFRSRNELVVVLAEPVGVGEKLSISIDYTGKPIERVASGAFVQRDTTGWYPHAGTIDRATYDVTIHRPEKLDVVAPGTRVFDGISKEGSSWGRWRLERPSIGFSFELGRYEFARGWVGDVEVSVAVDRLGQKADDDLAGEILATTIDVMEYYAEIYGPYPLQRLQVVSSPRGFSQGLLGFVSLSTAAVIDWDVWGEMLGAEDRRTVIAHEVAHQWWGNQVGWRSYRDQWISEAMATYSALIWAKNRLGEDDALRRWAGPTAGWQDELLRKTEKGRHIESLGPLVLGERLRSSISRRAYPAIVYKKGAIVLNMLSQFFQEEGFIGMLGEIVKASSGGVITTDDFVNLISRLGGTDLDWFKRRFIYGTGLPHVYYGYTIEELDDDRWAVVGQAHQRAPLEFRYSVVEVAPGIFDMRSRTIKRFDVDESTLVVRFRIGLAEEYSNDEGQRRYLTGRGVISGEASPFRFEVDQKPEILWLDRESEVFGRFYNVNRWPKAQTYNRGLDLLTSGDVDGGMTVIESALTIEPLNFPEGWEELLPVVDEEDERIRVDIRIHLALASAHLDAGRLTEAETEFGKAVDLVKGRNRWSFADDLLVVESRLNLLSGDTKTAFKDLKKGVLGTRGIQDRETWTLLAIAAHQEGDTETFKQARDRAEELGVALGPLKKSVLQDR